MKPYLLLICLMVASATSGLPNELAVLSDEFDDSSTLSGWQRLNDVEGWDSDKLELHDVNSSAPGQMRIMPYTTSWYMDLTGPLVFKEVSGDFVVTLHLNVQRRNELPGRPVGTFSLGGIMIRTPRAVSNANPAPDAAPGVQLPWPPSGYSSDWTPDSENYIFLSYGNADGSGAADQWMYEVKTTIEGQSTLYYDDLGVPEGTGIVTLQAVRIGSTFVLMRKHPGGDWIVENRYSRPDMPATLQVGITTYTDWGNIIANGMFQNADDHDGQFHHNHNVMTAANGFTVNPDLVVDAEYFRYARPPAGLTEAQLQALPLTSSGAGIQLLGATPLADVLGDAINQPNEPPAPDPEYRPDSEIGRRPGTMVGDGVYNGTGSGQTVRVKSRRRKLLRFFIRIENDGTVADEFGVRGTGGDRRFRVKYLEVLAGGGRTNVTSAAVAGVFSPSLVRDEGVELIAGVKRKGRPAQTFRRKTLNLVATSNTQPDRRDAVRGRAESR